MKKFTRTLVCAGLVTVLGVSGLTGCGNTLDGTKTAATCGDQTITLGTANMMLRMTQAQMVQYYSMFGGSAMGIWDQKGEDGKTYGETTKEETMNQIQEVALLKQHAADYKVEITEEQHKKIEEAAAAFMESNTPETIEKLAVSQSDIEAVLEYFTYRELMYEPMTADIDTNVDKDEIAQSKVTVCQVSTADVTDPEGNPVEMSAEEKGMKKVMAQSVLDKMKAQEDPAAADMDAIAKEVEETLTASARTFGSTDEELDTKVKEAVKDLKDGELVQDVVEGEDGYYVVRLDAVFDQAATDAEEALVINERKEEAYTALIEDWTKEDKLVVEDAVWKKVKLTDEDAYILKQPEMPVPEAAPVEEVPAEEAPEE